MRQRGHAAAQCIRFASASRAPTTFTVPSARTEATSPCAIQSDAFSMSGSLLSTVVILKCIVTMTIVFPTMSHPKGTRAPTHDRGATTRTGPRAEARGVASLRDVEAIEAPGTPPLPPSTYEAIRRGADLDPDAPALSFFLTAEGHRSPETWTYRALVGHVTQAANVFHRLGATRDTVIALVLPNLPETHFAIWGAEAAGIVMPMNPMLDGAALGSLLEASGAEILVTVAPRPGTDAWQRLRQALARASALRHVLLVSARGRAANRGAMGEGAEPGRTVADAVPEHIAVHDFASAMAAEDPSALASGRVFSASDPSSWFATGGTTGLPKLAMRNHGNEVANAWSASQALGDAVGPRTVVLCGLPLFHVNAVLVTGLLPFSQGAHVLLATPEGYRAPGLVSRFWDVVEHHRVNLFSGVPTLYSSLLQVPVGAHDVTSLAYAICGAAPMPTEVIRAFEERTGVKILEGYGLTEATCVSSLNPARGERRAGSIGLRLPGQQMKAVVLDERRAFVRDCQVGEVGAVVVSGPNVFIGYRDPAQNRGLWVDCGDGQRWLDTGDLGRSDAEGYFWLTGRRKELIIRGGHNIDPASIEEPLHRHPGVAIAAAVGRPDAHAGELPVAYVQPRPGAAVGEAELVEFLGHEIGERAALPKRIRVVSDMPLTAVGKIYKPELKRREAKDALEAALREAAVSFRTLDITQDPSRGMVAVVDLDDAASADAARKALGRFALPFTIRVAGRPDA
jgi:fatty-acyl-CoA synthase